MNNLRQGWHHAKYRNPGRYHALRESVDIECKLAQGKDGKGAFPKDAWETYSAFANSSGGDIFLGLREKKDGHFELKGIHNTQKSAG